MAAERANHSATWAGKIETYLLWNANTNSYVLYGVVLSPVTLSDPHYPKPTHFDICYRLSYLCNEWR